MSNRVDLVSRRRVSPSRFKLTENYVTGGLREHFETLLGKWHALVVMTVTDIQLVP